MVKAMRLTQRAVELPRLVLLAAALCCAIGVVAVITLPKERTPRIKLPVIVVAVPNPGAPSATNEKQIIDKIEEEVESSLDNLRDDGAVLSQAVNGAAIVQFVFDENVQVTQAKRDVESLINRIKGQFPPDAQQDPGPIISDIAFEDWPIIQVFVAGGADGEQRRRVADELEVQIQRVPGVSGVDIFGGLEREVQIEIDPNLMTLYGFSYQQVESAILRANTEMPSGSIESARGNEYRVRTRSKLQSIEAIGDLPLGTRHDKPIVLADIARVYMGYKPLKSMARYDGRDAVVLLARAKTDIDVMATANKIQDIVDRFVVAGVDSQDIHIGTVRSQAREIGYMIKQLMTSAMYGLALVVLILWIALGWRNAGLISLAVPFAILGTATIMWFTKQTIMPEIAINNMTLFAMILVVGMVVDGCIIVGENIYRHRELGRSPVDSAKQGISEVGGALVSAYLTTFAAFGPMFMVRGVMGDFLELLPIVVLFSLCSAMLVDHFVLPVLSVYVMKVPAGRLARARQQHALDESATAEQMEVASAQAVADASRATRVYGRMLTYALSHRILVLFMAIVVVLTPVGLFWTGAIGFEFFPDSDIPIIEVVFELPLGSSMEKRSAAVAGQIEQAVLQAVRPEEWHRASETSALLRPVTTIGEPGALSIQMENAQGIGPEFGMVYVELSLAEQRDRSSAQIRQAIADAMPALPGVIVRVKSPSEGPPAGAPVSVRVLGRSESSVTLGQLAGRAAQIEGLLRRIPGTYDVTNDYRLRPELQVVPNRMVASLFDIDTMQIATSVNYALEGVRLGEVDFGGAQDIDLRVRNQLTDRDQVQDLANLPLRSPTGKRVTLDQVASIDRVRSPNVIRHYDQQRVIDVRCELEDGVLVDDVKSALIATIRQDLNPSEQRALTLDRENRVIASDDQVIIEFGGENQIRDEALADLNVALMTAAGLMLIILVVKFNSFIQPLIVLFSVPLSLIGVSIGLMICGFHFSISAMIGLVALSGIVVNDAIVLVDFINRLRAAGIPIREAVVYAGQLRLRPIFLTTVTTIGGLLPLALNLAGGGEFWQPLTVTIMFGLGFATLLQLFIIPLACYTFDIRSSMLDPLLNPKLSGKPAMISQ